MTEAAVAPALYQSGLSEQGLVDLIERAETGKILYHPEQLARWKSLLATQQAGHNTASPLLQAALEYARRGWPVFPCRETPSNGPGSEKRPYWEAETLEHGLNDATTDPDQITRWWTRWPNALIGGNCGTGGIVAIDRDEKHGKHGIKVFQDFVKSDSTFNAHTGRTPSGGDRLIWSAPAGLQIASKNDWLDGVDVKAHGGYVILPPSRILEGEFPGEYTANGSWLNRPAPLPEFLIEHLPQKQRSINADAQPARVPTGPADPLEVRRAGQALMRLSANRCDSYEGWYQVGMALYDLGDDGLKLWDDWSKGSSKYTPGACAAKWTSFGSSRDESARIHLSSLFYWASEDDPHTTPPPPEPPADMPPAGADEFGNMPMTDDSIPGLNRQPATHYQPPANPAETPDLPDAARIDPALGADACTWLDDYVAFSRKWSPRAFDGLHEAVGLFVLSTVAARRVLVHVGKARFTNLYIALVGRSSLYSKTSTAEIGLQVLNQSGLSWLLAADNATPQKFISDLTSRLTEGYDDLSDDQKQIARMKISLAGQRGWFYDEFGQHVAAMMRDGGFMADFRGLLRHFDDTPSAYEYGSIGRGTDLVERPYLSLLANLTPADLRPFARQGSALWGDGFLARFALITPPEGDRKRDRFPKGERIIPLELIKPLRSWHERLGLPDVRVVDVLDKDNKDTGRNRAEITARPPVVMSIDNDVWEAFYAYHDGLGDLIERNDNHDFDGNYTRFAEKALRVSLLLASMSNTDQIQMRHWARAQAIVERWRAGLHELYSQLNESEPSEERQKEEKLLQYVQKLGGATAAEAARYVRGMSSQEASRLLDGLVAAGELEVVNTAKKTKRYVLSADS